MADLGLNIENARPTTSSGKSVAEGQSITVRRNEFLFEESPGNKLDSKTLKGKGESIGSEYQEISKGVIEGMRTYLNQYIDGLAELQKNNPSLLNIPGHEYEKRAWELMGAEDRNARISKIADFLGSADGIKFADSLLLQQASRKFQAVGLYPSTNNPGDREETVDQQTIHTGEGQGTLNRVWHDTLRPKISDIAPKANVVAGTLIGSTMAGVDIGSRNYGLRGFVLGGGIGLVTGMAGLVGGNEAGKLFKSGTTFDLKRSVDGLAALQTNPQEVEYLKRMYNIDISQFDVDVVNQTVSLAANADKQAVNRLRDEGIQALELHRSLYKDLGVPPEKMDTMPELNLFENLGGFEQSSSKVGGEVLDAFYEGGYDPTAHTLAENQERMFGKRSEVMVKLAEAYIKDEKDLQNTSKDRPLTTLKTKIDQRGAEGDRTKKLKEPFVNEKQLLEQQRDSLKAEEGKLVDYEALLKEVENLNNKVRIDFAHIPGADLDAKIAHAQSILSKDRTHPTGTSIEEQIADIPNFIVSENQRRVAALPATLGKALPDTQKAVAERVRLEAADMKTALEEDQAKWKDIISKLEQAKMDLESKRKALTDSEVGVVDQEKVFKDIQNAHGTVIGWGITDNELQTLDMQALLQRVNTINQANPAFGWPKEKNVDLTSRNMLMHALIESRAEERASRDAARPGRIADYTSVTSWGITDTMLRSQSKDQILTLINQEFIRSGGTRGWSAVNNPTLEPVALRAIEEAKQRFSVRTDQVKDTLKALDKDISSAQEQIDKVSLDDESSQIEATHALLSRQGEIFTKSAKVTKEDTDKFMNLSKYVVADETALSESERSIRTRTPKGYYEFMDLFFDYRNRSDRNDYFKKISTALPPQKLATLLNQSLALGTRSNLNDVLTEMNTRIEDGRIDNRDIRHAFVTVMDRMQEEALALS